MAHEEYAYIGTIDITKPARLEVRWPTGQPATVGEVAPLLRPARRSHADWITIVAAVGAVASLAAASIRLGDSLLPLMRREKPPAPGGIWLGRKVGTTFVDGRSFDVYLGCEKDGAVTHVHLLARPTEPPTSERSG